MYQYADSAIKISIGERVRKLRKKRNWTTDDLGKQIGISGKALGSKERGERDFTWDEIIRLSDVFEVTLDELIRGIQSKNVDVHRNTGLNNTSIRALRIFMSRNPKIMQDNLNKVLSFVSVLEGLARFISIPDDPSNGRMLESTYSPDTNSFQCNMSPRVYDSVVAYDLIELLRLVRSDEYTEFSPKPLTEEQLNIFLNYMNGVKEDGEEE